MPTICCSVNRDFFTGEAPIGLICPEFSLHYRDTFTGQRQVLHCLHRSQAGYASYRPVDGRPRLPTPAETRMHVGGTGRDSRGAGRGNDPRQYRKSILRNSQTKRRGCGRIAWRHRRWNGRRFDDRIAPLIVVSRTKACGTRRDFLEDYKATRLTPFSSETPSFWSCCHDDGARMLLLDRVLPKVLRRCR